MYLFIYIYIYNHLSFLLTRFSSSSSPNSPVSLSSESYCYLTVSGIFNYIEELVTKNMTL